MHENDSESVPANGALEPMSGVEEGAMSVIRPESFKSEIQRLRQGVSRLFRDETAAEEDVRKALLRPHLTIRDVMQTQLSTVRPESPLGPAVTMMIELQVSSLPVVDAEGRIVGALNQKDLLKVFYELDAATVASVMTTDPIVMSIGAPLIDVIDQLMSSDFRRVLIQENDRLVGVIVRTHLMPSVLLTIQEVASRRTPPPH
jgi:CBS domain-containing membrane protein